MIVWRRLGLLLAPIQAMEPLTLELAGRATIETSAILEGEHPAHARGPRLATPFVNGEQVRRPTLLPSATGWR